MKNLNNLKRQVEDLKRQVIPKDQTPMCFIDGKPVSVAYFTEYVIAFSRTNPEEWRKLLKTEEDMTQAELRGEDPYSEDS